MKRIALIIVLALVTFSVHAQKKGPVISFETEEHDFGTFDEGEVRTYEFSFTNTGDSPLIITNVVPSCGCTTPGWTREPIMPGKTGFISAKYDSNGRPGGFNRSIRVVTNEQVNNEKNIFIKGNVNRRATTDF